MTSLLECPQCHERLLAKRGDGVLACAHCHLLLKGDKLPRARELFAARQQLVRALWKLREDFENSVFDVLTFKERRDDVAQHLGLIDEELAKEVVA